VYDAFSRPKTASKKLWRNLDSVEIRETVDDNISYTPDQLNTFFVTPQTVKSSNTDFDSAYEEFAFINTFELEVYNAVHQIRSNAVGADGVLKFLNIILPHILLY
jgi:hypothetical protein